MFHIYYFETRWMTGCIHMLGEIRKQEWRGFIYRIHWGRTAAEGPQAGSATGRKLEKFPKGDACALLGQLAVEYWFFTHFPEYRQVEFFKKLIENTFNWNPISYFLIKFCVFFGNLLTFRSLEVKFLDGRQQFSSHTHNHSSLLNYYCTQVVYFVCFSFVTALRKLNDFPLFRTGLSISKLRAIFEDGHYANRQQTTLPAAGHLFHHSDTRAGKLFAAARTQVRENSVEMSIFLPRFRGRLTFVLFLFGSRTADLLEMAPWAAVR